LCSPPELGDPIRAARSRESAASYSTPWLELEAQQVERQRALQQFQEQAAPEQADAPKPSSGRVRPKRRDRRRQPKPEATKNIGAKR